MRVFNGLNGRTGTAWGIVSIESRVDEQRRVRRRFAMYLWPARGRRDLEEIAIALRLHAWLMGAVKCDSRGR